MCRPSADIVRRRRSAAFERGQRPKMRVSQVADVNVVPEAGAIGGRVILTEYFERRPAVRGANGQRNQMDLRIVVFANLSARVGTRGVEVAQRDPLQSERALEMWQRPLDREFRFTVRVGGMLLERLDDWHRRRLTVNRAGRGEHESANAGRSH